MSEVTLRNVKKIYPFVSGEGKKKRKKKKDAESEKKSNLQITDKGVVAVQDFNLDIRDKEFIVLVGPSGCGKIHDPQNDSGSRRYIRRRTLH